MSGSTPGSDLPPPPLSKSPIRPEPPTPLSPLPTTTLVAPPPPTADLPPSIPPSTPEPAPPTIEPTIAEPVPSSSPTRTMSDPEYPTIPTTTAEPPPPVTTTISDLPPPVTTATNPPPVTTTDPPPPVTTTTTTIPPPETTTTTNPPVITTISNPPPDTTTSPERTITHQTPPPITTTTTEIPPPETTPPYTTQYITTVSVVTITTLVPHATVISGSVTTVYIPETTTSLQPTLIPDPRQPLPPPASTTSRNGVHPWQVGLVVALVLILLAICLVAVILAWFRRRRQELRDQEDKVVGSREPWNDPATAAAVMGSISGGDVDGSVGTVGVMHPGWHDYNKEATSISATAAAGGGGGREMSSMDGGYRHLHHHHHPESRYGPNGELILIGYAGPYDSSIGEDSTDYLGGHLGHGHGRTFSGSDDYGLGLDYAMAGSEIGGAELASYSGSLGGDQIRYSGGHRYPIPPPLQQHQHQHQQHVSSNHHQEEQPASPVARASYEDDYHAAVALRQQLQQQQQQQPQSRVFYPKPPQTSTSAAATSRQPSRDEFGTTTSGTTEVGEGSSEEYRLNLEKYSKVEHRRQSPHALLVLDHQAGDQDGDGAGIVASPLEGPVSIAIAGAEEEAIGGKEVGHCRDDLNPGFRISHEPSLGGGDGGSHERGPSTPGEERAAVRGYLDRLRVDDSS